MQYKNNFYKVGKKVVPLEVYKVQVALFGGPSVLIYNEDKTQVWEEHKKNNVETLINFIGKNIVKCYCAGYQNEQGQIVLVDKVEEQEYWF